VTSDVDTPHDAPEIEQPAWSRGPAAVVVDALANAPERLLVLFLWFCYVTAVGYVTGQFRPLLVVPATAVVLVATWRFFPGNRTRGPGAAVGSALALVIAGTWFLLNLPYIAERVQITRDPDLYTLAALRLLDHPETSIGRLHPQGNHLVSGVSAVVGWVFGETAVFWGNLACGAAALVALYVLARRLVGPWWGLVPMVALAVSMPMLEFSRALYSEPLAMTFTFLGATLLLSAWARDSSGGYALAGAAFGGVALARVDGVLPLLGVLVGLTVAAFVHPGRDTSRRRWAAPLVLLGSLPGVLLGLADLYFHSGTYMTDLAGQFLALLAGFVVATVVTVAGPFIPVPAHRLAGTARVVTGLVTAGGALAAVALLVLFSRPWWYVSHGALDNPVVQHLQQAAGDPVDGTRLYSEQSFTWISWYYGWPVVVVGLAGLITWLVVGGRRQRTELLWLAALFLPSALLYLASPRITPDQIWAMRRFLPVVVPGALLATAWVGRALSSRGRFVGPVVAAVLAVSVMAWPLTTVNELWTVKEKGGALRGTEEVCRRLDGRAAIVLGVGLYVPTVLTLCDVPAVGAPDGSPEALAEARDQLGGGPTVLLTRGDGGAEWIGRVPQPFRYRQTVWEYSLDGPPDAPVNQEVAITFGLVRPDGRVVALPPLG
jgi:hypothetical protein